MVLKTVLVCLLQLDGQWVEGTMGIFLRTGPSFPSFLIYSQVIGPWQVIFLPPLQQMEWLGQKQCLLDTHWYRGDEINITGP